MPADTLLHLLMKDDRLALHFQDYREQLRERWEYVQDLPGEVWEVVAKVFGGAGPELRSKALSCAHISLGFIHERVWSSLDGYPWKLVTTSDTMAQLQEIKKKAAPPSDESLVCKVWLLAYGDFPLEEVAEGLELLRHISWSSATVEQQHASAAQVHRRHHMYGMNALTSRALVHTARLFWAVRPVDKQISVLEQKLQEELRRAPLRVRAQGMFFREASSALRHRRQAAAPGGVRRPTQAETTGWMKVAMKRWTTLPDHLLERCEQAARIEMAKLEQVRFEKVIAASKELATARFKKRCASLSGLPPRMIFVEATFSQEQTQALSAHLNNSEFFSHARVAELRKAAVTHNMLSKIELAELHAHKVKMPPSTKNPWWLSVVVWCREAFVNTALRVGRDSDQYYKFLFAKQVPYLAAFCPLQREHRYTPLPPVPAEMGGTASPEVGWLHYFSCDRLVVKMADELDASDDSDVFVLTGLVDQGNQIVGDGPIYNLAEFVAGLPGLQKVSRKRAPTGDPALKKEKAAEWEKEVALYPWLAKPAESQPAKRAKTSTGAASSSQGPDGDAGEEVDSEVSEEDEEGVGVVLRDKEVAAIFNELDEKRAAWEARYGAEQLEDLRSDLLGGPGIFKACGVVADFVWCEAHSRDAKMLLPSMASKHRNERTSRFMAVCIMSLS